MIWFIFGTGFVLGVFTGILLLGILMEPANRQRARGAGAPNPAGPGAILHGRQSEDARQLLGKSLAGAS